MTITPRCSGGSAASAVMVESENEASCSGAADSGSRSASTSRRVARERAWSIARFTTIRCSHGPNGRRRSNLSSARMAAMKASWAMSSAAAESCTTR